MIKLLKFMIKYNYIREVIKMSIDNLNENEIRGMKAEISARRTEVKPTFQHYGSVENLSDSEIRNKEA